MSDINVPPNPSINFVLYLFVWLLLLLLFFVVVVVFLGGGFIIKLKEATQEVFSYHCYSLELKSFYWQRGQG